MKNSKLDSKSANARKSAAFRRELIAAMKFPEVRLAVWMALNELENGAAHFGRAFESMGRVMSPGPKDPQ